MKRIFAPLVLGLFLALLGAHAEGPDDLYLRIFELIQEGDTFRAGAHPAKALAKYTEAQTALLSFQRGYPDWNARIVNFRLTYLATRIAEASANAPAEAAPPSASAPSPNPTATNAAAARTATNASPVAPDERDAQLQRLRSQVSRLEAERDQLQADKGRLAEDRNGLQADKSLLEAKLKEALSLRPAAVDPAQLARAEEKITSLQKENDLLKVALDKERAQPASGSAKALAQARQTVAELNRKLAAESTRASALTQEKQALESKLSLLPPNKANNAALAAARNDLAEANRQLAREKALTASLQAQKTTLEKRLDDASHPREFAALQAENQALKQQLAELKTASPGKTSVDDLNRQLTAAQAQIAALEGEKEILRLEKIALQNHLKTLASAPPVASPAAVPVAAVAPAPAALPPATSQETARIRQLERERDDLQKKLQAAYKQLYDKKGKGAAQKAQELENKLERLQARLDAFEARQVPYTSEELALFEKPAPKLPETPAPTAKGSVRDLPPAAANLVIEARRLFAAGQYDKAEENYQEVLRQQSNNVPALANLAAIEMERGRFDAADTNLQQALSLQPDNPYSLTVLGQLKFRQAKYDDALDALSRAAKLEPRNPEVQNYLGLTLSEKGMRGPAEAALRKAIQLDPGYASAHNNLAVIYLTQQPPAVELARWHYQRALAAGNPRNPELEKMLETKKAAQ